MGRLRFALRIAWFSVAVTQASIALAQTPSLSGRVTDPQGGAVVGAEVTLMKTNEAPQTTRAAADGTFMFQGIAPGQYRLQIDAAGFARWAQGIAVGSDVQTVVATLQIAGVSEDVTVAGVVPTTLTKPESTGSRLGLTPVEIPASIQILPGAVIRERGDMSISEATTRAVGVTSQWTVGNGGGGLSARGFTTVSSVKQLYDGIQLFIGANTVTFPFDSWAVDRIEILGGPASVLYGNGAIGGAVNVIPRKPNPLSSEHTGRFNFGSNNTWRAALDSTGPINARLSYRFDVSHNSSDGWLERGDSNNTALSASVRYEVSPKFNLVVSEDFGRQRPMNYYGVPLINGRLDESLRRVNYNLSDADTNFKDNWTQVKADWTPSAKLTVRSNLYFLAAERFWHRIGNYTYQPQAQAILRDRVMEVVHHERQVGTHTDFVARGRVGGRENSFSAGVDYNWVRLHLNNNNPASGSSLVPVQNPSPGLFVDLARSPTVPVSLSYANAFSAFAEDRLSVAPRLALVGGVRYDVTEVDRQDFVARGTSTRTFKPANVRGGVVYDVRPRLAVYGQFANATDSIGDQLTQSAQQQIFDLTTGRQVEVGAKQVFLNDRGEWTFAVYNIVKKKLLVPDANNPTLSQQVGQQSSRGVEASAALSLGDRVRIEANGTVLRAQFDDFAENVGGRVVSRNRNRPPNVPHQAANLWFTWNVAAKWQARSGIRYVGERFINNANTWRMPGYTVVDAGLRSRLTDRLTLDVRIYNALDEVYPLGFWNGNAAAQQWLLGAPRAAEVGVTTSF